MSNITSNNAVVAIYKSHTEAEAAVKELQRSDFDMEKLLIVGRDCHTEEHVVGYYTTGDRMRYWGKQGAFWGGIWGLLFGSAFFSQEETASAREIISRTNPEAVDPHQPSPTKPQECVVGA